MKNIFLAISNILAIFSFTFSAMALTNSQPAVSDELQSNVFIKTEGHDPSDGSSAPAYCNATFVHPQVLVTAAHCVRDAYILKAFTADIQVGKYKFVTKPDGTVVRIGYVQVAKQSLPAKFIFPTQLTTKINSQGFKTQIGPQEDIALIILGSAMQLSQSIPVMPVISQQELRGITQNLSTYLPTVISVNPLAEISTTDTKRSATLNQVKWNSAGYLQSTSSARVEEGDSGAPLLIKTASTWKLIGVVKGRATTAFSNYDVFAGLDNKACDMARQIGNAEMQALICY